MLLRNGMTESDQGNPEVSLEPGQSYDWIWMPGPEIDPGIYRLRLNPRKGFFELEHGRLRELVSSALLSTGLAPLIRGVRVWLEQQKSYLLKLLSIKERKRPQLIISLTVLPKATSNRAVAM